MVGAPVRIINLPDPGPPGSGQVLVAMKRSPINPADRLVLAARYAQPLAYPLVAGAEGVGEVIATGIGVNDLRPGDHVLPLSRGNWTTHRLIGRADLIVVPRTLDLDQAATLRINPATAWRLLQLVSLPPGGCVAQNGATSHVARWVRAIAASRDVAVIDIVRDEAQADGLTGAVIDDPDLASRIGARHIPLALDCVAGEASGRLAGILAPGGTLAVFGHLSGAPCSIASTLLTGRNLNVRGFSLRPQEAQDTRAVLQALYDNLAAFDLPAPVAATYPLSGLEEALAHAARPGLGGRVMLALDA